MGARMATDFRALVMEKAQLPVRHHQLGLLRHFAAPGYFTGNLAAERVLEVLELTQDRFISLDPRGGIFQCVDAQVEFAQIQLLLARQPKCLDHVIVPHPATFEEGGGYEEGGRNFVAFENGPGNQQVIGVAVVECDRGCRWWQGTFLEPAGGFAQWQNGEGTGDKADHPVELFGRWFERQQRIGLWKNPVKNEDAELAVASSRRQPLADEWPEQIILRISVLISRKF